MIDQKDRYLRVELHAHTCHSKDSLVQPERLLSDCQRKGIDRIAITDHNAVDGAFEAKALDPERVIVGEEIETTQGELIAYFVKALVPAGLEPLDTIERLKAQNAVISVAHPFDPIRSHQWDPVTLIKIAPFLDAIEVFNARCLSQTPNTKAAEFAREQDLLATVGSDAHSLWEVGRATLWMADFNGPDEFLASLRTARQETKLSPALVHLFSRYAVLVKKLL